ncbi:hypothetical protein K8R14_04540 [bacterium]|nr:hypothetical protein [bacterium]
MRLRIKKNKTYLLFLLIPALILILLFSQRNDILAEETLCPSYIDPDSIECLDYLRDQLSDINSSNSNIQGQLEDEAYKQLSLQGKIEYIDEQIAQTELAIQSAELEIAAFNIEIKIMEDSIGEIEDDIALSMQEINQMEKSVNLRLTESYKYTFIGPLEIFLNSSNLDHILRKTKYLLITKDQDVEQLTILSDKEAILLSEEEELSLQSAALQQVRNDLESEQKEILVQRMELNEQKDEKAYLLSESIKKEEALLASWDANRIKQGLLDEAVMQYIAEHGDEMADYGWVSTGDWIGNLGGLANGCSTGPHIHFSIDYMNSGYYHGYGQIDPWGGYLTKGPDWWTIWGGWKYYYIRSNSLRVPLSGMVVLTQDHHILPRKSIDIYSLNGYGSPVYAAMSGNLFKGTDRCGDTYAVIENSSTGLRTAYFHLQ